MDTEIDLTTASRDVLIAIIAQLQATVLEQQRVIERLERRVADRVEHVVESCPDCGTHLTGGWTQRTREVIELPVVPVQVTEQVFIARTCPACRRRCIPPAQLDGVALGRQRLGVNLISRIATLREEGRLPIRSIQWYLRTVHQLRLSVGAIVSAIHQTAQQAQPAVAGILDRIRASPVVHADETGWRQNGNNGYVWTFSTPCPASTIFAGWRQSVLPVHLLGLDALLGSVGPVAGDVKLQDDGVVHDPVNRRGGGHGVGKDALPLGEDQV